MLNQSKAMRIWNILYPICIYFAVTTMVLYLLQSIVPETADSKLFRQLLTSLAVFPFLYSFYHQDQEMRGKAISLKKWKEAKPSLAILAVTFVVGGCFALAWNNVLGVLRISEYSASYAQVQETFYTGRMLLEITALCIVIPFVEELLYRGIVYGRLKDWLGVRYAVFISAVIFGLIHMNLVQFIYAAVFGLLLAYFREAAGNLLGAVTAHMAANLTSVLRAETSLFAFMDANDVNLAVMTIALFGAAASGVCWLMQRSRK